MNRLFSHLMIAILISSLGFFGCTNSGVSSEGSAETTASSAEKAGQAFLKSDESTVQNILQIAVGSEDHSTLVAAVQATELENVLANNGPLTVFAPTNAAFDKLPEGTLDDLLKPENKKVLADIIWYHAAPGTFKQESLRDGMEVYQATGDNVAITHSGDDILVNGNKILGSVDASNGVVHVIDGVLLPPEE